MTTNDGAIRALDEVTGGQSWEIRTFRIDRTRQDGHQRIDVTCMYRPGIGWLVSGEDHERGLATTANPHDDLGTAIRLAHWQELDR